jgi:hypothetical protein
MKSLSRLALAGFILMSVDLIDGFPGINTASAQVFRIPVRRRTSNADVYLQTGVEVLTRGPIHEAFAELVSLDPEPGLLAPEAPPDALDEAPPDEAPDLPGGTAEWIPGYWAWDDGQNEYIWVSGVWRVPPLDADWVPGRWAATRDGYRWIAGFWSTDDDNELDYVPPPPENLDEGPVGSPPGPDFIWAPGAWYFEATHEWRAPAGVRVERRSGFFWRPGYWLRGRPNYTWIPAHYVWSPSGDVFVDGHWDLAIERRGVLFAPVRVEREVRHGFRYVPQIVIGSDLITIHLFTRPRYDHYYFGDYYSPRYVRRGFYPWSDVQRGSYDPIFTTEAWRHRDDPHWLDGLRRDFEHRRIEVAARPPDTYRAQLERIRSAPQAERPALVVARSLTELKSDEGHYRFHALDESRRAVIGRNVRDLHDLREQRAIWESEVRRPVAARPAPDAGVRRPSPEGAQLPAGQAESGRPEAGAARPGGEAATTQRPYRVKLPHAPITGRTPDARRATPPEKAPQTDAPGPLKIKRKPDGTRR